MLWLNGCHLSERCCEALASVLSSNSCSLRELDVEQVLQGGHQQSVGVQPALQQGGSQEPASVASSSATLTSASSSSPDSRGRAPGPFPWSLTPLGQQQVQHARVR
ncbi:unnamed protein product [Gadus morhua 'NCC']